MFPNNFIFTGGSTHAKKGIRVLINNWGQHMVVFVQCYFFYVLCNHNPSESLGLLHREGSKGRRQLDRCTGQFLPLLSAEITYINLTH